MHEASLFEGLDYDSSASNSGSTGDGLGVGDVYSYWDKDSISLCVCDTGYFGPDCSFGMFIYLLIIFDLFFHFLYVHLLIFIYL